MYEALKEWLLWLLRVPPEPLDPMGDVGSLRVFRAAPAYLRYRILGWAVKQAIALIVAVTILISVLVAAIQAGPQGYFVAAIELIAVLLYPLQALFGFFTLRLDYEVRWYKISDRSLRVREGVWNVHEMTMTFANIQNINVMQGPLQRFFGIADVRVETAGGGGAVQIQEGREHGRIDMHVGIFRGVDNAEEIRDLMMVRLRQARDTGLGDLDERAEEHEAPGAAAAVAPDADWAALLGELRDEAAALRAAAERLGPA